LLYFTAGQFVMSTRQITDQAGSREYVLENICET